MFTASGAWLGAELPAGGKVSVSGTHLDGGFMALGGGAWTRALSSLKRVCKEEEERKKRSGIRYKEIWCQFHTVRSAALTPFPNALLQRLTSLLKSTTTPLCPV